MSVGLFKCDWFKLDGKWTELKDDGFFRSINVGGLWYKHDSYILTTQARKVFYLSDTKIGKNWHVVHTFEHMHLYNVSQIEGVQYNGHAYQEDAYSEEEGKRKGVSDITYESL
jgi:hypothetical protein